MIGEEDRARLGELAMRALDLCAEHGETAQLGDAIVIFEVLVPDPDDEDGSWTHVRWSSTVQRSVVSTGLVRLALQGLVEGDNTDDAPQ